MRVDRRRGQRGADLDLDGGQRAGGLDDQDPGQVVHGLAELGPVGGLVAEAAEGLGGERVVDDGGVHCASLARVDAPRELDRGALAALIDHTLLAPTATEADVVALCAEAADLGVAAVCVSPGRLPAPGRLRAATAWPSPSSSASRRVPTAPR